MTLLHLLYRIGFTIAGAGTMLAVATVVITRPVELTDGFGASLGRMVEIIPFFRTERRLAVARWLAGQGGIVAVVLVALGVMLRLPDVWIN